MATQLPATPVNIQPPMAMNFTPKPLGVLNPPVPSNNLKAEPLKNDTFDNSSQNKSAPSAKKGLTKATGAILMLTGALTIAGGVFVNSKKKPVTTIKELGEYIEELTQKTLKQPLFELSNRKIKLFFPAEEYLRTKKPDLPQKGKANTTFKMLVDNIKALLNPIFKFDEREAEKIRKSENKFIDLTEDKIKEAKDKRVNDVKKSLQLIQEYIARFNQDGLVPEIKVHFGNPTKANEDNVKTLLKNMNTEYKFSNGKLLYELPDDLLREVERIELDHRIISTWFEGQVYRGIDNPVVVTLNKQSFGDNHSLSNPIDWLSRLFK